MLFFRMKPENAMTSISPRLLENKVLLQQMENQFMLQATMPGNTPISKSGISSESIFNRGGSQRRRKGPQRKNNQIYNSAALCVFPLRSLRLMDFNFLIKNKNTNFRI